MLGVIGRATHGIHMLGEHMPCKVSSVGIDTILGGGKVVETRTIPLAQPAEVVGLRWHLPGEGEFPGLQSHHGPEDVCPQTEYLTSLYVVRGQHFGNEQGLAMHFGREVIYSTRPLTGKRCGLCDRVY